MLSSYRVFQESRRKESNLLSQKTHLNFEKWLPNVLNSVPNDDATSKMMETVKKITEHSANDKRKLSGIFTIFAYETLIKPETHTEKTSKEIKTLAWSVELVHSYSKILEDIEMYGLRNQGNSCWHAYDASLCRSCIYEVIKANFADKLYVDFVPLFDKAFLNIAYGQYLDRASMKSKTYNHFNMEQYNRIIEYKTTFHCFKLPILLSMRMLNMDDKFSHQQVTNICSDLGRLYQIQADFLDVYGEEYDDLGIPNFSGDIRQGKFCWPAVAALQRFTPAQRVVFTSCYGSSQPAHIERVKFLYDQIGLPKIYKEEKTKITETILSKCKKERLSGTALSPKLFLDVLDAINQK
ncbi:farnesyl pyrophosphate synthase-like [Pectinophora gossypiella]|uniref:farnesyl pyrophosphate synthase-like n=1 Tax=Pectinophora gossypiella TaxID=13191 RepID=UPI00214E6720|nr:farnesyl pyrophosphate synthase-like [Pectinophora gossypiella]